MRDISLMIDNVKLNYRVGLLIDNGEEIFIECNNVNDYAVLPGGRVKTLEDTITALKREIKEEMHVELKDNELEMHAFIENFFNMDNIDYHELYVLYKINVNKDDQRFINKMKNYDSDTNYYLWVNKKDLKNVKILPETIKDLVKENNFKNIINNDLN